MSDGFAGFYSARADEMRPPLHIPCSKRVSPFVHCYGEGARSLHGSTWPKGQPSVIESQYDPR